MHRIVQTILGVLLLGVAGVLAIGAVNAKGTVALDWPTAAVILAFATIGGFFVSKSLMTDLFKTVASAATRARKGPTP
jgi:hypothetical protein